MSRAACPGSTLSLQDPPPPGRCLGQPTATTTTVRQRRSVFASSSDQTPGINPRLADAHATSRGSSENGVTGATCRRCRKNSGSNLPWPLPPAGARASLVLIGEPMLAIGVLAVLCRYAEYLWSDMISTDDIFGRSICSRRHLPPRLLGLDWTPRQYIPGRPSTTGAGWCGTP